jgi:hypothetical protein
MAMVVDSPLESADRAGEGVDRSLIRAALALSPEEACDLADLLVWHAQVAKSRAVGAGGGNVRSD